MSFNKDSVQKLNQIKRKLPQKIETDKKIITNTNKKTIKIHQIEKEQDPNKLFKQLINSSPDGNIPKHLLKRLKELEDNQIQHKKDRLIDSEENDPSKYNKATNTNDDERNLYSNFQQLLLEEEE
tara:strand:- start:73 stop:447 length:375 start_codon:yes stop_codon:yes gene_type:complete